MSQPETNVHVRRSKLRRFFETELRKTNKDLRGDGEYFFVRFSPHMVDRLTDRNICEHDTLRLINKLCSVRSEVLDFLKMENRPMRLELTDGVYWLGMTVDAIEETGFWGLTCRMIIKNRHRLQGKTSTHVIKV